MSSMETAVQQRTRILHASPETSPTMYDSAVALGYQPEDWRGMWKIAAEEYPILWLTKNWALVHEVVYEPGTTIAKYNRRTHASKKRWVLRRTPRI